MKWYVPVGALAGLYGLAYVASNSKYAEPPKKLLGSPYEAPKEYVPKEFETPEKLDKVKIQTPEGEKTYTILQKGASAGMPKPPIQTAIQPPVNQQVIYPPVAIGPQQQYQNVYPSYPLQAQPQVMPYPPVPLPGQPGVTPTSSFQGNYQTQPAIPKPPMSWQDSLMLNIVNSAMPGLTSGINQASQNLGQQAGNLISSGVGAIAQAPSQIVDFFGDAIEYLSTGDVGF